MSAAMQRFADLQRKFRAQLPSKKLSATQRHHLLWVASLQQVAEQAIAAMVTGATFDRGLIDKIQAEVRARVVSAGARPNQEKKGKRQ